MNATGSVAIYAVLSGLLVCSLSLHVNAQAANQVTGHVLTLIGRPVPRAKVTAGGLESVPAMTDSAGAFVLSVHASPGQTVTYKVERDGFDTLTSTSGLSEVALDFRLHANRRVSSSEATQGLGTGLKIIDPVFDQMNCADPPCARSTVGRRSVQVREDTTPFGQVLVFVSSYDNILGRISPNDIDRLDNDSKMALIAYAERVQSDYDRWTDLTSKMMSAERPTPDHTLTTQLGAVGLDMCTSFKNILTLLHDIDIQVWDHYGHIKGVCEQFASTRVGRAGSALPQ